MERHCRTHKIKRGDRVRKIMKTKEIKQSFCFSDGKVEECMATHSSILAWRIPCTEELGGRQFIGSQSSRQD